MHTIKRFPSASIFAFLILAFLFVLQMIAATNREVMSNDEGYHTYAGFRYWQCGDFGVNPEHPPLAKMVAALPLRVIHVAAPAGPCPVADTGKGVGYGDSNAWLYTAQKNARRQTGSDLIDLAIPLARRAMTFWALLLVLTAFFFTRRLFGDASAVIAVGLIAFEPTLIAHGALVTTDMALSSSVLLAVAAFYAFERQRIWWRLLLAGLACGLWLSVKHSGILIVPTLGCIALAEMVKQWKLAKPPKTTVLLREARAVLVVLAIAIGVLWATYHFRFAARPEGVQLTLPLSDFIAATRAQGNRSLLLRFIPFFARFHLLPEGYLYGFVDVLSISNPGQSSFLFGHLYPHGVPQYFPSVALIKTTLGMLVLALLTAVALLRKSIRVGVRAIYFLSISAVWMAAGMVSTLNIGYRHILPLIAPICCLLGAATVRLWQQSGPRIRLVLAVLLVAHGIESLASFPNEIAFGNLAFGGVTNSHRLLTDSNNDWSQALPQVSSWLRGHQVTDCWFAYDGSALLSHSGIPCRNLVPNLFGVDGEPPALTQTGTFIISGLSQSGIEWERPDLNPYATFQATQPVAVVGGADMVYQGTYDLSREVAVHRTVQAMTLSGVGHFAEAATNAQIAIGIMPNSALAHLQYANALKGLKRNREAHKEYVNALMIAEPKPEWYFLSLPEMRKGEESTR